MTASSSISKPIYRTDKTTNQIISALNAGKKVLIILDNESIFNIVPAISYVKIEFLNNETQFRYELYIGTNQIDKMFLSSNSLQDPFVFYENTGGDAA